MTYASAYTIYQKYLVAHFTSLPSNVSLQLQTDMVQRVWTVSHMDFSCVTKANGLYYAYTSAERSAMIDWGILPLHVSIFTKHLTVLYFISQHVW